jgi:hypothetical protein
MLAGFPPRSALPTTLPGHRVSTGCHRDAIVPSAYPMDIAKGILFLTSDDAGLIVDGGLTAT